MAYHRLLLIHDENLQILTCSDLSLWEIGCSSGFGRRLVNSVLARGDRVVATARTVENIKIDPSPRLHVLRLDVTSGFEAIKATVDEASKVRAKLNPFSLSADGWLIGFRRYRSCSQ